MQQLSLFTIILLVASAGTGIIFGYSYANSQGDFWKGYAAAVKDLYIFNSHPDNWTTEDRKFGIANFNGTSVDFRWQEGERTYSLSFKSADNLGYGEEKAILLLKADRIRLPQQIADALNLQTHNYYVLVTSNGQKILERIS